MSTYRYADHPVPDHAQLTKVRVGLIDCGPMLGEWVWALPLDGNTFRIENVVVFDGQIGLHDEVIALDLGDGLEVVDVVTRRTLVRFCFNLPNLATLRSLDAQPFRSDVAIEHGGAGVFIANLADRLVAAPLQAFLEAHANWFERCDNLGAATCWDDSDLVLDDGG